MSDPPRPVVVIDNYDSFTYNLVQRLGEIDSSVDIRVCRNDELTVDEIGALNPARVIISPGPCTPNEAGVSVAVIDAFIGRMPILGVCLGHQSIGQALGASIVRAPELMHGKTDTICHDDGGLFAGVESPFVATRYHSLVIAPETLPSTLRVSAWTDTGPSRQIMGVRHVSEKVEGWQFHPESFLTQPGTELLKRFLVW